MWLCFHAFMKADLRISIKDDRRKRESEGFAVPVTVSEPGLPGADERGSLTANSH
jgi:hypothetical protein